MNKLKHLQIGVLLGSDWLGSNLARSGLWFDLLGRRIVRRVNRRIGMGARNEGFSLHISLAIVATGICLTGKEGQEIEGGNDRSNIFRDKFITIVVRKRK
jgi:hypothetical protein